MSRKSNWFKISSIYIGTVIGAGFASGQEILQFFGVYGYKGIFGILVTTLLFSFTGSIVLMSVYNKGIKDYRELIYMIFGSKIGKGIEVVVTLFLLSGFCIMVAGSGAVYKEQFNIPYVIGVYVMLFLSLLTFIFDIKGLSFINILLVPILIFGIIFIGLMVMIKSNFQFSNIYGAEVTQTGNWITSAILYFSYNSISAIVVLSSLSYMVNYRDNAIKGGIFGGIGLGFLAIFILIPILIYYTDINGIEIPMLKITEILGYKIKIVYSIIIWFAMFTTAIANGFGFIRRLKVLLNINQIKSILVLCIIAIPLSKMGFLKMVTVIYPFMGYLGLFMMITIFLSYYFYKRNYS